MLISFDDFDKMSAGCVALHPSSLQRTTSTLHSSVFARLAGEHFTKSSVLTTSKDKGFIHEKFDTPAGG
jgi:transposase